MKMVPKMLSPLVRDWAPEAFVISFKLETDPQILLDKSRQALEKYRHQVVVANVLESRRTSVIIVTRDSQTPLSLSDEEVAQGMEIEEKIVSYLQGQHTAFIERKGWGATQSKQENCAAEGVGPEQLPVQGNKPIPMEHYGGLSSTLSLLHHLATAIAVL